MENQGEIITSGEGNTHKRRWTSSIFLITRVLVSVAIIELFIGAVIVILVGLGDLFRIITYIANIGFGSEGTGKYLAVNMTEMIDLNLIGIVLMIIAIGLYQLFIQPDIKLPDWLDTPSLETLKERLLRVIVVLLPVIFLGFAAMWTGGPEIAALGFAIAVVTAASAYALTKVCQK